MSSRVDSALNQLEKAVEERVVCRLATKYNFESTEALKWLRTGRVVPSIPLPFCGVVEEEWCKGVRLNHGLHTQCVQTPYSNGLCKTCMTQTKKNKSGDPTYGRIESRLLHIEKGEKYNSWRDPAGKLVTPYNKVMQKLGISRLEAEKEAESLGWKIPEEHFDETVRTAGRPRNSTVTSDTESEAGDVPVRKRGRPRKNKDVVTVNQGDDPIVHMLSNAEYVNSGKKAVKRKVGRPLKLKTPIIKPDIEPNAESYREPIASPSREEESDSMVSSDENIVKVTRFEWNGILYLRGPDNVLYDVTTEEEVGVWSTINNCVMEIAGNIDFD